MEYQIFNGIFKEYVLSNAAMFKTAFAEVALQENKKGIYLEVDSVDKGANVKRILQGLPQAAIIQYIIFFFIKRRNK